ncbi:hypothetical protein E8E12_005849 [Didymella heteroderae]|uniref:Protein kinase domain-containing protein n=1 Tax=Didymella heteroderae TaxID=1769908 RepID=A0A9P4WJT8_9PLEO|nr:hypothetical protein E8E12_005849 [Didymella heteroderae]
MKNDDEVVPGNPNSTAVVALKIFKKGADGGMDEATRDFNIELNILKQLRKCKTKHDAIMLDWGSITIVDNQGVALSHSLIFKLATFSLEDLLKDEKRAQRYLRKNVLLAGLVDVVEALECLHEKVHTFHFDIKPDNILIFEKKVQGPESEVPDQYELIWKLSDFGLARKKVASQKASMSSGSATPSVSSTLPATRPPGLYQAPEVQQQNVSAAGQGSDVWSMGIVALMVLAYMSNGPTEVLQLKAWLNVSFPNGGKEPLTYVRSDQRSWRHRKDHKCCYLPNHDPDTGSIPGSKLKAALNPKLIEWSNDLYLETYHLRPERTLVKRILEVIFGSVLLIDRGRRMCAADVRKTLAKIQEDWSLCDTNPESYKTRNNISDIYCSDSRSSQEASQGESPEEPSASQDAESDHRRHRRRHDMDLTPSIVVTGPPNTQQGIPGSSRDLKPSSVQASIGERPESQESSLMVRRDSAKSQEERIETLTPEPNVRTPERSTWVQESLCSAIEKNDPTSVRLQLRERGRDQLSQICPGARRLPIHWALCKNAYDALDVLLEHSSKEITNLVCNRRTALDLACEQGKPAALDCIRKYREKFDFPPEVYRKRHKNLGYEAKVIADDLFEIGRVVSPRKRSFFGLIRSRGSDTSG